MKIHFTILCLLLLTACPAQANQDAVIVRLALVYAEAIDVAPTVGRINAGSGVSLFERKGGWKQIYFAEKPLIGWVRSYPGAGKHDHQGSRNRNQIRCAWIFARLDRVYEYDADKFGVVLAARAGYDPYAMLDVLTTIDSINPESSELTVMLNTPPPTADRLDKLAKNMDGRMEQYASGQIDGECLQQAASHR